MGNPAKAKAAVAGVGAGEHRTQGVDAHVVHDTDNASMRFNRMDQDTGTDERFQVETADRSGMWAAGNYAAFMSNQRYQNAETEQRIRHAEETYWQTHRHYEDMHTMRYGVAGEMVEAIANRVWDTCPWGSPAK